jgi:hypothetical protein
MNIIKTIAWTAAVLTCTAINGLAGENELTPAETKDGWKLLFDGKTTEGWHSFKKTTFPQTGWVVENHTLKHIAGGGGGDLISQNEYDDFELEWDWSVPAKSNNGIKYFVTDKRTQALGHEYQMIDDSLETKDKLKTASFYDVLAPKMPTPVKTPGEWNHSKVLVKGNHVEHWLNGQKVLEYELGSPEVLAAVQNSKFKTVEGFGTRIRGHIMLTEHHDEASFKNIKIRELSH